MGKRIIIIGSGPGGYCAAIKAAQMGAEVIIAETEKLGGTCLNIGCVPTKSLLHIANEYKKAVSNSIPGVRFACVELDWPSAQRHKDSTVSRLSDGIRVLLRNNGVAVRYEKATPLSGQNVMIGDKQVSCDAVIIATGSVKALPPIPGSDLDGVLDSKEALSLDKVPKSLLVIGGGVVGVEFAAMYNALGSKVTIFEMMPHLLPSMDTDISEYLQAAIEENGISVHASSRINNISKSSNSYIVEAEIDGKQTSVTGSAILIATGRKPNTGHIGLEKIGVSMTNGAIDTDEFCQSSIQGLYAVGDCNGKSMFAHAAMAQGELAAKHIINPNMCNHVGNTPICIYTKPEVASVGITEKEAAGLGLEYKVGHFSLSSNARAILEGSHGFVKIIADSRYGEVLGVHMIGPFATEMIAEAALCMNMEGTVDDIVNTIHAHPTVSESVREAAMSVFGKPIHGV